MFSFKSPTTLLMIFSIQSSLGDLLWIIEKGYAENIRQEPIKDTTRENRIYPVVVFPDKDLEINLTCIKEGYVGPNDPDWKYGGLELVRTTPKEEFVENGNNAKWTSTIKITSKDAGIKVCTMTTTV